MNLLVIALFVFSAALAAGAILLVIGLLEERPLPFLRSLFYHNIFISAFGFYGIWGQFIIVAVAGDRLDPSLYSVISVFSLLLGLPFLVFGWLMLIRFAAEAGGFRTRNSRSLIFVILNFVVIAGIGFLIREKRFGEALPLFRYYYIAASLLYALAAFILLARGEASSLARSDRFYLSALIVAGAVSQALVLMLIPQPGWMALAFVFLLLSSITVVSFYLKYRADFKDLSLPEPLPLPGGTEDFFLRHEISPREAEIIAEICNGLSNQEIADKLFISLQTVKDHTSRIYMKTNVRNRMQLMTVVRGLSDGKQL